MTYKITYKVSDSTGNLVHEDKQSLDLTDPTVDSVKSLLNPGTYTNIKSERFVANGLETSVGTEVITKPFIYYSIELS